MKRSDSKARKEQEAFVSRLDATRLVLMPGASITVGPLQITLVERSPEPQEGGWKARLRVGDGACFREVVVGPRPGVVKSGGLSFAIGPESDEHALVLVMA
jgi:hypothetical protein